MENYSEKSEHACFTCQPSPVLVDVYQQKFPFRFIRNRTPALPPSLTHSIPLGQWSHVTLRKFPPSVTFRFARPGPRGCVMGTQRSFSLTLAEGRRDRLFHSKHPPASVSCVPEISTVCNGVTSVNEHAHWTVQSREWEQMSERMKGGKEGRIIFSSSQ